MGYTKLLVNDNIDALSYEKRNVIPTNDDNWGQQPVPTNWGFPPPPPPPGSWGNTAYPSASITQGSKSTTQNVPTPSSTPSTVSVVVVTYSLTRSRNKHRTHRPTPIAQPTPSSAPLTQNKSSKSSSKSIGPIIGGAVGGVCGAALIAALFYILSKRSKKMKRNGSSSSFDMYGSSYWNNTNLSNARPFVPPPAPQMESPQYHFDYMYSPDMKLDNISPNKSNSRLSWGESTTVSGSAAAANYSVENDKTLIEHHSELILSSEVTKEKPNQKDENRK